MKFSISVILILLSVFLFCANGFGEWWLDREDDELEDILLTRIDTDIDAPFHEMYEGLYGFWSDSQQWITVMDFGQSQVVISPYTWSDVYWKAGSLDKY